MAEDPRDLVTIYREVGLGEAGEGKYGVLIGPDPAGLRCRGAESQMAVQ